MLAAPSSAGAAPTTFDPAFVVVVAAGVGAFPGSVSADNRVSYGYGDVGNVDVAFMNQFCIPAETAALRTTYSGQERRIRDVGVFAPGIRIERHHRMFACRKADSSPLLVEDYPVIFTAAMVWRRRDSSTSS